MYAGWEFGRLRKSNFHHDGLQQEFLQFHGQHECSFGDLVGFAQGKIWGGSDLLHAPLFLSSVSVRLCVALFGGCVLSGYLKE